MAKSALIVASGTYEDAALSQLCSPTQDAKALARVLKDPAIGGFDVRVVEDRSSEIVCGEVEAFFDDRAPDDLVLLYYSGHGIKDAYAKLYFATKNTAFVAKKLRRHTAVSAEFVNDAMKRCRSQRQILLLDCCYGGAFRNAMLAKADVSAGVMEQLQGEGRVVLTASSALEYSFEEKGIDGHPTLSIFTRKLVEGLESGKADLDYDGLFSLDEVYQYVCREVRRVRPEQTPTKTSSVQGELFIGNNPTETHAPLPAELRESLRSPHTWARIGAVHGLHKLLRSGSREQVLAARAALKAVIHGDDSTEVRTEARRIEELNSAHPVPDQRVGPSGPSSGLVLQGVGSGGEPRVPSAPAAVPSVGSAVHSVGEKEGGAAQKVNAVKAVAHEHSTPDAPQGGTSVRADNRAEGEGGPKESSREGERGKDRLAHPTRVATRRWLSVAVVAALAVLVLSVLAWRGRGNRPDLERKQSTPAGALPSPTTESLPTTIPSLPGSEKPSAPARTGLPDAKVASDPSHAPLEEKKPTSPLSSDGSLPRPATESDADASHGNQLSKAEGHAPSTRRVPSKPKLPGPVPVPKPQCESKTSCGPGKACRNGRCVARSCGSDPECEGGFECKANRCIERSVCGSAADCVVGKACEDGLCVKR